MVLEAGKLLHGFHTECVVKLRSNGGPAHRRPVIFQRSGNGSGEDIETRFGKAAQLRFGNIEILGEHLGRRVSEPTGEQEGRVFRKACLIEDQEELASVGPQALNGMWMGGGEEPKIADSVHRQGSQL